MFGKPKYDDSQLNAATDRILAAMEEEDIGSEDYIKMLDSLNKIEALKTPKRPSGVSSDVKWTVLGNALVALIIVAYERSNVLTSKAVMFMKAK